MEIATQRNLRESSGYRQIGFSLENNFFSRSESPFKSRKVLDKKSVLVLKGSATFNIFIFLRLEIPYNLFMFSTFI